MKLYFIYGLVLSVALVFALGAWKIERYYNYKFSYQVMVQTEINRSVIPLEKRIEKLEAEIKTLKK